MDATVNAELQPDGSAVRAHQDRVYQTARGAGAEDEAWYWGALILLEQRADRGAAHRWWADKALALNWLGAEEEDEGESEDAENDGVVEGAAGWKRHVAEASQMLANPRTKLG